MVTTKEFLLSLIANTTRVLTSRMSWVRGSEADDRRDYDHECGWPKDISIDQYRRMYERNPIAARVVQVFPKESWQVTPDIYENEDPKVKTPFEIKWEELSKSIRPERSYFQSKKGSPIWEYLKRADQLSGIGRYGVMLIGLDDGSNLSKPASLDATTERKLTYIKVFPEYLARVSSLELNKNSSRYGFPLMYELSLANNEDDVTDEILTTKVTNVHWTRIVHIADNLESSETYGIPRMQQVFNALMDMRKLYGGSAEMYWQGAFPGFSFESDPALGGDVDIDVDSTQDQVENYFNGLQRYLALRGLIAKSLAPQCVDPTPWIERQIESICIKLGIPKRIFMGSERGELASAQDDAAWNDRIRERQLTHVSPHVIIPFIDRLINLGVLPVPESYQIAWPDITSQTSQEKSQIAFQRTQALAQYSTSGAENVMPLMQYLTLVFGITEDEALKVVQLAEAMKDKPKLTDKVAGGYGQDNISSVSTGSGRNIIRPPSNKPRGTTV